MNHWARFERLYVSLLVFISIHTGAAVAVFSSEADLDHLSRAHFWFDIVKCIAMASSATLAYLQGSKPKPVVPTPTPKLQRAS